MDKKLFEELIRKYCVVKQHTETHTVWESGIDPETGLETEYAREIQVQTELQVVKLKPHMHHCHNCDLTVTDQNIQIRLATDPVPHWRQRCATCRHYLDPETGQPMMADQAACISKIGRYWKNKHLGIKKWQRSTAIKVPVSTQPAPGQEPKVSIEVTETADSTITVYKYHDDK
jgi:hypothetical protein